MEAHLQYPASHEFQTAIVWFRRDLRVDDNPALVAALNASANVIPVFIWAPEEEGQFQPGRCSRWWTKHSLVDLQQAIAALGSRLVIRRSADSTAALLQVVAEVGAEAVFFNHLYDPISLMRDHDCKRGLTAAGVAQRTFNGDMLYEPWEVLDAKKQPYSTFDDFWNCIRAMPVAPPFPVSAPDSMPPVPASVSSLTVTEVDWFFTADQEASSDQLKFKWKPGVGGAIAELESFAAERLHMFEHDRAKVDRDSTSRLSPWIHIGSISVRYIFYRVRQCQAEWMAAGADRTKSCDDFLQQVGYREYSRYLSFHFPFIHERSLLRHLRACPWRIDQHAFKAWRQGQTGYPIVDAAMRQLWSSGWCHNRARVVAASFLVKDLLLPWQWGLKHYWDAQIDADLECDALGWQYVSGGMSDAHPFSYMMDLESEARRFDPDGEYVRRWLPVLSRMPTEFIHSPWKAPMQVLASADVELGCNYPMPIISRKDADANVQYACSVLDKCVVSQPSDSSGRYPYRAPTHPVALAAAAGASSGANPTGAAGAATGAGPSAGTGGVTGAGNVFCDAGTQPLQPHHPDASAGGPNGARQDSRCASAANGGISSGCGPMSGPLSGTLAAGMEPRTSPGASGMAPPPPPQHYVHHAASAPGASGGAEAEAVLQPPIGGAVYYHPGDSAGQQMLERILQQQRRSRGAAQHQDGSGTNKPPSAQQPQQPFGAVGAAGCGGPSPAAAAWAAPVETREEDEEAAALWQHQQMLQGGAAAFAFEQAMQLLLARRRMGDGVSNIVGDLADGEGPDGLVLDDVDSEEVVSNTVNLNVTAFTGASCHRNQAGTARGARQRGRADAAAAAAGKGSRRTDDDEHEGSPGGSPKSGGDEADPYHGGDDADADGRRARGSLSGDADDDDEAMCEEGGENDTEDGSREEGRSPQGGESEMLDGGVDEGDGKLAARGQEVGKADVDDRMVGCEEAQGEDGDNGNDGPLQTDRHQQQILDERRLYAPCAAPMGPDGGPAAPTACAPGPLSVKQGSEWVAPCAGGCEDAEMASISPRCWAGAGQRIFAAQCQQGEKALPEAQQAPGLHKRRRSGSAMQDWE